MLRQPAAGKAALHRQDITHGLGQAMFEHARNAGALFLVVQLGIGGFDIVGQRPLLADMMPEILKGRRGVRLASSPSLSAMPWVNSRASSALG